MVRRRWYAIRVGDFIEVRSTIKGIKKITSTYTYPNGNVLTHVAYEGGRLVTTWGWADWYQRLYGHGTSNIPVDGYLELKSPEIIRAASSGGSITWMNS